MAQFDVHENAGRLRDELPYVLNVQSSQFDAYARRIVVPLAPIAGAGPAHFSALNPVFRFRGKSFALHPLTMVSIPVNQLGAKVASLAADSERIVAALEEVFSRAWG